MSFPATLSQTSLYPEVIKVVFFTHNYKTSITRNFQEDLQCYLRYMQRSFTLKFVRSQLRRKGKIKEPLCRVVVRVKREKLPLYLERNKKKEHNKKRKIFFPARIMNCSFERSLKITFVFVSNATRDAVNLMLAVSGKPSQLPFLVNSQL